MDDGLAKFKGSFPRTTAALRRTLDQGLNTGGQIYISTHGHPQMHASFGFAAPGVRMANEMAISWFSAGKPITAIAIGRLVAEGAVRLDDPVAQSIPEFAQNGKETITLRHLLTHTGGFRSADNHPEHLSWDEIIAHICAAPLERNWIPGEKAGYSTRASWFILAQIVQQHRQCNFEACIRREVLEPIGMRNSSFVARPQVPFAPVYTSANGALTPALQETSYPRPGSSARGPINELGRFYESLCGFVQPSPLEDQRLLREFTTRQRIGMYDQTFLHIIDMGLGFIINSNEYGAETVPYGYGKHASSAAFGHSGNQCSCAFADPSHGLVVAWCLNQQPGERLHQKRVRDLNSAIYEDLGLG
ncbi:MAG TPA: serine hydrolase domain-containing protein [Methylomirabilota bacterium]|nr:serine hydrolase domain-containing protein [Methylomirabilota bacterium]